MDKAIWKKANENLQFVARRLDTKQQQELNDAVNVMLKLHGQACWNEAWNKAVSLGWGGKAAPASAPASGSAPAMPAPVINVPPVTVNFPKGAIVVQNHMPADVNVRVQTEPTETRLIRDESGNISGAVTS